MLSLEDRAQVAVIGAGPAGCFFAHQLLQLATQRQQAIRVTLFDGKDFTMAGPAGCNRCAGVLSHSLLRILESERLLVPDARVQREIAGYYLQLRDEGLDILPPEEKRRIVTVFRGNGPRFCPLQGDISFDDFLLERVKEAGAEVLPQPVRAVELPSDPRERVRLVYGSRNQTSLFEADLVVGAFGVNSAMTRLFADLGFGYRPPRRLRLCQAELPLPPDYIQDRLQNRIFTFSLGIPGIYFAAWVPKAQHVSITVVCEQDATKDDLLRVLEHPAVRQWLPEGWTLPASICMCYPYVPLTAATHPYTDRVVLVGDACCARYFKNGIESAYITARLAAQTAVELGISVEAFRKGYERSLRRSIIRDNRYGRLLFGIDRLISRYDIPRRIHLRVARWPVEHPVSRDLHGILWSMATGDRPYRRIFWQCLQLNLQFHLLISALQVLWETLRGRLIRLWHWRRP